MFSEDENDIVKQYQARLHAASDGKKPNKDKGNTTPPQKMNAYSVSWHTESFITSNKG